MRTVRRLTVTLTVAGAFVLCLLERS
jgi:hypothetical protein